MDEPNHSQQSADETPEASPQQRREAALRKAALVLVILVPCLWAATWYLKRRHMGSDDPCAQVKICDPEEFKTACRNAHQYPEIESAVAVLGYIVEERCPENSMTCEVDLLGGRGPVEDGCVLVYERGTGRILESRWHRLAQ